MPEIHPPYGSYESGAVTSVTKACGCRALRARHRAQCQGEDRGAFFIFSLRPSRKLLDGWRITSGGNLGRLGGFCGR